MRATEENPSLVFEGASDTARVRTDGLEAGLAAAYSGERSLSVLPGRHVVEVVDEGGPATTEHLDALIVSVPE